MTAYRKIRDQVLTFAIEAYDYENGKMSINDTIDRYELISRFLCDHENELTKEDKEDMDNAIQILMHAMDVLFARG